MPVPPSTTKVIVAGIVIFLLALVYYVADARYSSIFPKCIFHSITGLYCPGCGTQRAVSSLLHGDVLQALNYNALFMVCLPLVAYSGVVSVANIFRLAPLNQNIFYSSRFVKIVLATVIAFWILRNIPGYPFSLLAPHLLGA